MINRKIGNINILKTLEQCETLLNVQRGTMKMKDTKNDLLHVDCTHTLKEMFYIPVQNYRSPIERSKPFYWMLPGFYQFIFSNGSDCSAISNINSILKVFACLMVSTPENDSVTYFSEFMFITNSFLHFMFCTITSLSPRYS